LLAAVISGIALGSWIAATWELAMLRIIQAYHPALNLNVLAVCAVLFSLARFMQ
jgi:hypothetical protein